MTNEIKASATQQAPGAQVEGIPANLHSQFCRLPSDPVYATSPAAPAAPAEHARDDDDPMPVMGGRESLEDALAVVESFGPGIDGLNDTFARQVLLAHEVRRLRAAYEQAAHGRSEFRNALAEARAALALQAPAPAAPVASGEPTHWLVMAPCGEGVVFDDKRDALWTQTGRNRPNCFPVVGEAFRDCYGAEKLTLMPLNLAAPLPPSPPTTPPAAEPGKATP